MSVRLKSFNHNFSYQRSIEKNNNGLIFQYLTNKNLFLHLCVKSKLEELRSHKVVPFMSIVIHSLVTKLTRWPVWIRIHRIRIHWIRKNMRAYGFGSTGTVKICGPTDSNPMWFKGFKLSSKTRWEFCQHLKIWS